MPFSGFWEPSPLIVSDSDVDSLSFLFFKSTRGDGRQEQR